MKQRSWKELFETVGLIAVVASLIFVGQQLRQDHVIARSQLGAETFERLEAIHVLKGASEFSEAYAKMLIEPERLTDSERVQLDSMYQMLVNIWVRECYLVARGIYVECGNAIRMQIRRYFGNRYAKSWWKANGASEGIYTLPEWVDSEIENADEDASRRFFLGVLDGS